MFDLVHRVEFLLVPGRKDGKDLVGSLILDSRFSTITRFDSTIEITTESFTIEEENWKKRVFRPKFKLLMV